MLQTLARVRRDPQRVSQFVFSEDSTEPAWRQERQDSFMGNEDITVAVKEKADTATPVKVSRPLRFMLWAVDGSAGTVFMTVVTLWALFGDDIRLLTTNKEMDSFFVDLTLFCLVCFGMELGAPPAPCRLRRTVMRKLRIVT